MTSPVADRWSSGNDYEAFMGRWSRLVAAEFVPSLGVRPDARWLEVGCGTGELSRAILGLGAPSRLVGVDPSDGFIDYAREHIVDDRVRFEVGTATELPSDEGPFDVVVLGLVLNFIPDRPEALAALRSALEPGGILAAYVWDYGGEMWFLRHFWAAAHDLDPEVDEAQRFGWCNPPELHALFENAGLDAVETSEIVIPTLFDSFDDYWLPFLGGTGTAPSYVATLSPAEVDALRDGGAGPPADRPRWLDLADRAGVGRCAA